VSVDNPTAVDASEQARLSTMCSIRTLIPGVVVSYDPALRKASVQPMRLGSNLDGTPYTLPIVPAAPILWPRFAGMIIVGRLNPGDTVMLAVSDRELDQFLISPPSVPYASVTPRTHVLTDAVCVLGLSQDTNPLKGPPSNPTVLHVGREDLLAFMQIGIDVPHTVLQGTGPGSIRLGLVAAQPVIRGTLFATALGVWLGAFAAANGTLGAAFATWAGIFPNTLISNTALSTAVDAWVTAIGLANGILVTSTAAALSTKVLTE